MNKCDKKFLAPLRKILRTPLGTTFKGSWWDIRGVTYFELLPAGEPITSDKFCQ